MAKSKRTTNKGKHGNGKGKANSGSGKTTKRGRPMSRLRAAPL